VSPTIVHTKDGIQWYCEQRGSGPDVVLIPSGEGDCSSFDAVASTLADSFRVTTFDMPGFSRSTAPEAALTGISAGGLATQVVGLLDELEIAIATVYGCSSGGQAVLSLVADHPDRVRRAVVHEVAMFGGAPPDPRLAALVTEDDATVVLACRDLFATMMNEDAAAWRGLGTEFHRRLDLNYVTWVRRYLTSPALDRTYSTEELTRRPVTWTIGALNPAGAFFANVTAAHRAGIDVSLLPCRHFPQVSVPDDLAAHLCRSDRSARQSLSAF
jgi:pimeloyl-ACP methyl ester carboxylesterase